MSTPQFNIIENAPEPYEEKYEEFIRLYNETDNTIIQIYRKLGWNDKILRKARDKALTEGKITPRRNKGVKNYFHNRKNDKWKVRKVIKGKSYQYIVKDEKEAKELVEYLNIHGWNYNNVCKYREKRKWDSQY